MSMASPTLRSSSSTLPWPSCSSWATDRLARPSTAEMFTGTSNTGARSEADLPSVSTGASEARASSAANSSSVRLFSSAMVGLAGGNQGFGVQALGGAKNHMLVLPDADLDLVADSADHPLRIHRMLAQATDLEFILTRTELEALILESNLVKSHKPRYNIVLRDDKHYPS